MKIVIGCDHAGIELKPAVVEVLQELGMDIIDVGVYKAGESADYPVYGAKAAHAVASGEADLGIVMCGTGIGIGIAANKVKGIRCATCTDPYTARMSRAHNNANMLALGARVLGPELAKEIIRAWIKTSFQGERHARRVGQIIQLENGAEIE